MLVASGKKLEVGVVPYSPLGDILHVDVDQVLRRGMRVGRH